MPRADVVVVGAGLAGLACAAELAEAGASVFLAAKGMATTHWTHGGVDVAAPRGAITARAGVRALARESDHPFGHLEAEVEAALDAHRARLGRHGIELSGSLDAPLVPIPTAIGALRPASILPAAQAAALEPWGADGLLIVGIAGYRDAWPHFAARNLDAMSWPEGPARIRAIEVELPGLAGRRNLNSRSLATMFDDAPWRADALRALATAIPDGAWRVAVPPVLGIGAHRTVLAQAVQTLGHAVIELPSLPPSVPGMRMFEALRQEILGHGGRVQIGFDVVDVERAGSRVVAIHTEAAARTLRIAGDTFVLATGGIAGEGLRAHPDGSIVERVFGLAVTAPERAAWFSDDPLVAHPLEAAGIRTDPTLRPLDPDGSVALDNVRVIGSALAGIHALRDRCGDGVALASAHRVASSLARTRAAA